jgi:hypothetical protein
MNDAHCYVTVTCVEGGVAVTVFVGLLGGLFPAPLRHGAVQQ